MAKRPRILEDEVIAVMRAIYHRHAAMEPVEDQAEAAALYRVLWRLKEDRRGPPHYPEINPQTITMLLEETGWLTEPNGDPARDSPRRQTPTHPNTPLSQVTGILNFTLYYNKLCWKT